MRPDWDTYFMDIAEAVARRSTCARACVGAVIAREKRILTTGFNGSPSGQPHCDEVGHLLVNGHCTRTIHAELNAIIQAALHGIMLRDATCYVTHFPCPGCAKALANVGLARLVYRDDYCVDAHAREVLEQAGVSIERWAPDAGADPANCDPAPAAPSPGASKGDRPVNSIVHWEIPSTDMAKSRAFYEALFDWEFDDFSPSYAMFEVEDGVGGALQLVEDMPGPGIEVYIDVDDITATLAKAVELGGSVAQDKTEIGDEMGYWAGITDPCGCRICIWSKG